MNSLRIAVVIFLFVYFHPTSSEGIDSLSQDTSLSQGISQGTAGHIEIVDRDAEKANSEEKSKSPAEELADMFLTAVHKLFVPSLGEAHDEMYIKDLVTCGETNCHSGDGNFYSYACCTGKDGQSECCPTMSTLSRVLLVLAVALGMVVIAWFIVHCPPFKCCRRSSE